MAAQAFNCRIIPSDMGLASPELAHSGWGGLSFDGARAIAGAFMGESGGSGIG